MPSPVEPESQRRLEGPTKAGFLYSDTGGDGPVVVFLHGVLMNGTLWSPIVDDLRHRYRCIVPELPFGAHSRPMPEAADLGLSSLAIQIADLLEELQLRDVTLACNDWGGAQLVVWPGRSTRVANLMLVSCEAFDNYPPGLPGRLLRLSAYLPGGIFLAVQSLRSRWIRRLSFTFGSLSKKGVPDDLFMHWLAPARHDSRIRRDLGKYLRTALTRRQLLEWAARQKDYRGQVLIVWARDDRLMPRSHAERLAAHFQNAELVWIDDSRTLIPIDQPKILTIHLRRFLDAHTLPIEQRPD